jgi:hypothetical protein
MLYIFLLTRWPMTTLWPPVTTYISQSS